MERLQKIISAAGVASRRKAEELITSGLVQVNGQTVTELGAKADAGKDHIRVNGKLLKFSGHNVYILLNKPKGYVTTLSDPEGRPTIVDLLHGVKQRVYPVGRLDYASEGLLLLTNDGELANALTKAASRVPKTYLVKVSGQPSDAAIEQLRAGIELPDRKGIHSRTAPAGIQLVHKSENPWYEVTLIEGRNRQIRAMFEQSGHHVEKLKRVRYGPFTLDVHPGKHRNLLPEEVEQLRAAVNRGTGLTAQESVGPALVRTSERNVLERGAAGLSPADLGSSDSRPSTPKPLDHAGGGARATQALPKKGPQGVKFERKQAPFQKRAFDRKPDGHKKWEAGKWEARKWEARSGPPNSKPRLFGKPNARQARLGGAGGRPDWKKMAGWRDVPDGPKPTFRTNKPGTGAPRKWTQGAPAASDTPRRFQKKPGSFGSPPDRGNTRPDRPGKPYGSARGEDSRGERGARRGVKPQGRPARPGSERKPFWQGADKRRPHKPKVEGDFEQRESRTSGERPVQGDRPRKTRAVSFSRPKFSAPKGSSRPSSKPFSRPPSGSGKKRH